MKTKQNVVIIDGIGSGHSTAQNWAQAGFHVVLVEPERCLQETNPRVGPVIRETLKSASLPFDLKSWQQIVRHRVEKGCHVQAPSYAWMSGSARFIGLSALSVGERVVLADRWIVLDGSIARATDSIFYTDQTLYKLKYWPDHWIVVGGGAHGLEMAQIFRNLGSRVSVVEKEAHILPNFDRYCGGKITEFLQSKGIVFHIDAEMISTEQQEKGEYTVHIQKKEGEKFRLRGNAVFWAVGRESSLSHLGLEKTDPARVSVLDACAVPRVQVGLELVQVGLTEKEVKARELGYQKINIDFQAFGAWGLPLGLESEGVLQCITHKNKILGATLVGVRASEWIAGVRYAIDNHVPLQKIPDAWLAYEPLQARFRQVVQNGESHGVLNKVMTLPRKWGSAIFASLS